MFMSSNRFLIIVLLWVGLIGSPVLGDANISSTDSLYFFHQRTIYLENIYQQGAWWANPATVSSINTKTFFTSNTGLLGGKYSISSVRLIFPVKMRINGGIGITGTGTTEGRSFAGTSQGAQLNSNFSFTRPSLEAVISYVPPIGGEFGGLAMTGTESIPRTDSMGNKTYFFWGIGIGWFSPALFKTVKLSFTTLSVCHAQFITWWNSSAKAGLAINVNEGALLGSLEYAFSLNGPISLFINQNNFLGYEVVKADVSLRFRNIAGFLLGFSADTRNFRNNGPTFHTGLELRRSTFYPYYGGYEIGINFFATRYNIEPQNESSPHFYLLHRFWIGYDFKKH
jgi:hypothetical protein